MENFFIPEKIWKDALPFPHVLVLLGEYPEFREYARAHHGLLAEYGDKLGVIPKGWLHATIQGIFHPLDTGRMNQLRGTLPDELAGMQPFQVQLGPVWLGVTAVTVAVYPEDGMAEFNGHVRTAMENRARISLPAREARFWAHTSVA